MKRNLRMVSVVLVVVLCFCLMNCTSWASSACECDECSRTLNTHNWVYVGIVLEDADGTELAAYGDAGSYYTFTSLDAEKWVMDYCAKNDLTLNEEFMYNYFRKAFRATVNELTDEEAFDGEIVKETMLKELQEIVDEEFSEYSKGNVIEIVDVVVPKLQYSTWAEKNDS